MGVHLAQVGERLDLLDGFLRLNFFVDFGELGDALSNFDHELLVGARVLHDEFGHLDLRFADGAVLHFDNE